MPTSARWGCFGKFPVEQMKVTNKIWPNTIFELKDEPRPPNTGGQKRFPPQVKMVNMIYATHIPKREWKRALRDVYAIEPVAPKFNPWSACPITFDRKDHPTSIRHGGSAALVLDPIINWFLWMAAAT